MLSLFLSSSVHKLAHLSTQLEHHRYLLFLNSLFQKLSNRLQVLSLIIVSHSIHFACQLVFPSYQMRSPQKCFLIFRQASPRQYLSKLNRGYSQPLNLVLILIFYPFNY